MIRFRLINSKFMTTAIQPAPSAVRQHNGTAGRRFLRFYVRESDARRGRTLGKFNDDNYSNKNRYVYNNNDSNTRTV